MVADGMWEARGVVIMDGDEAITEGRKPGRDVQAGPGVLLSCPQLLGLSANS